MAESQGTARTRAKAVIAGSEISPVDLFDLVKKLKDERAFGLARKVLDRCCSLQVIRGNPALRIRAAQERALSTYKDADLPADEKLENALAILSELDLENTTDRETLGLAGAIYKRRWELTAQERDLQTSFAFYHRGHQETAPGDDGYTGLNAAFVLDLLADHESGPLGALPELNVAQARRDLAQKIRRDVVAKIGDLLAANPALRTKWWLLVSLAEAHFGLEAYEDARKYLLEAKALQNVADWEQESTARQLATLYLMKRKQHPNDDRGLTVLRDWLDNDHALMSVIRGKAGLALSGGGFRASLFHIGLLARLAELDLLRSIEYLSCVSGGSIIGAYYYLEVRNLLQTKRDAEITRQDYIDIVHRIEKEFLEGVQRNIRTRILAEWGTNFKMMFVPDYSRTVRAGELYESELYSRVKDGGENDVRWLNKLLVTPLGEPAGFSPKDNNWRRSNKVPILVLNATTLNTGHNWQFTATWMGEPPASIGSEVDANYRLRRLYYEDAPDGNKNVRLGHAVAASACVPGIFDPLSLTDLYEHVSHGKDVKPIVRLVDGGVHDNQGTAALLEQGCNVLIVSDASGQMDTVDFPGNGLLDVPLRANSILQARVREAQYRELSARRRAGLLKGFMFIHLKQDLDIEPVDWVATQDPSPPLSKAPLTGFDVQKDVQRSLAAIRTDLDSFSEVEAYALMCDAYLMTSRCLKESVIGFELPAAAREPWTFLQMEDALGDGNPHSALRRQLGVSGKLFFKIWSLSSALKAVGAVAAVAVVAGLTYVAYRFWDEQLPGMPVSKLVLTLVSVLLPLLGLGIVSKIFNYRKTLQQFLTGLGLVTAGALFARLHLHVFDKLFLRQGRLDAVVPKRSGDAGNAASPSMGTHAPGAAAPAAASPIQTVPLVTSQAVEQVKSEAGAQSGGIAALEKKDNQKS